MSNSGDDETRRLDPHDNDDDSEEERPNTIRMKKREISVGMSGIESPKKQLVRPDDRRATLSNNQRK